MSHSLPLSSPSTLFTGKTTTTTATHNHHQPLRGFPFQVDRIETTTTTMTSPPLTNLFKIILLLCLSSINSLKVVDGFSSHQRTKLTTRPSSSLYSTQKRQRDLPSSDNDANESSPNGLTRRQAAELSVAGIGLGISFLGTREVKPTDYGLWGVLPVGTYKTKKTLRKEIVPGKIWTFETKFGILNVQVPLRMTIVKLSDGGLFMYNPVAATKECLSLIHDLVTQYGPVKHIVVGSVALEHKVYAGVMAQKFPKAQVWLTPGQYSFPVNLPDSFLGFPASRTKLIPQRPEDAPTEWTKDFDFLTLGPLKSRDGAFAETVFRHKESKTLIVTDTVLEVTEEVPEICELDPAPLLYHARDTVSQRVENTPEVRKIGWRRIALFALFFTPSAIDIKDAGIAFKERRPDIMEDFLGIYPWDWVRDEKASFDALTGGLLVAPILQTLILNRTPIQVLDFADKVSKWDIERIIPAHFKNDLKYNGKDFRKAFSFLEASGVPKGQPKPLDADLKFLKESEEGLIESGAIVPCPPMPGGKFSRDEILAQTILRSIVL